MTWKQAWLEIYTETFEGVKPGADGTYYVQGKEALLPILDGLTAEQASKRPSERVSSIAAHARHTAYYVSLINASNRGEKVDADWPGSWSVQQVDDEQWREIKKDLQTQFEELKQWVENHDPNDPTWLMAQLAHAAFHLGSVRQLAMTLLV